MIRTDAEPDPDDLDVGYSQLASEFNSETADGERRAAPGPLYGSARTSVESKEPGSTARIEYRVLLGFNRGAPSA